ncbi:hypothetical protein Pcinc_033338 [Petrolisthes cinctipes]|uniref:Uncharacterized protein n=1 Tax=Petrolisthes cinctipes TaxID=88211 RepID=A0AAE1JYX4_PETCI|nr:hypothetical protein Pcinc_033338 [Petrolisthes cinctipes]
MRLTCQTDPPDLLLHLTILLLMVVVWWQRPSFKQMERGDYLKCVAACQPILCHTLRSLVTTFLVSYPTQCQEHPGCGKIGLERTMQQGWVRRSRERGRGRNGERVGSNGNVVGGTLHTIDLCLAAAPPLAWPPPHSRPAILFSRGWPEVSW